MTGDVTYYAIFTAETNEYTVTYSAGARGSLNGGSSETVEYGDTPEFVPGIDEDTGYDFIGWYQDSGTTLLSSANVDATVITGDTTFTAQYSPIEYTVTYDINGGDAGTTDNSSHVYDADKNLTTNGYTKTGYTFEGWATTAGGAVAYTDAQSVKNLTDVDGDTVTLYAVWEPIDYSVTYDINGGDAGTTDNSSHVYDEDKNLTTNGYTRTGYAFEGWATTAGGAVAYTDAQSVKNLTDVDGDTVTLYAVWEPIDYSITYIMNGGTNNPLNPDTYTILDDLIELEDPTQEGYTFLGWTPTDNIPAGSTGAKNIYCNLADTHIHGSLL